MHPALKVVSDRAPKKSFAFWHRKRLKASFSELRISPVAQLLVCLWCLPDLQDSIAVEDHRMDLLLADHEENVDLSNV